jgi:hypothetical protein
VFCPNCIYVFRMDKKTDYFSLSHWLTDFITEGESVYWKVRTGSLCFMWIWEQTAYISLYSINWFYNWDGVCLLSGTDWVFMCFVWIWEQTAIIPLYSINWLVFITEPKCVYCAVRTGSLNHTDIVSSFKGKKAVYFSHCCAVCRCSVADVCALSWPLY